MSKLIAVHEIVYTDAAGRRAVAAPGSTFQLADQAQVDLLLRVGAARKSADQPAVETATLAGVQEADGTVRALAEMTKAELLEIATGMEITGASSMTKAALIEAIEAEEVVI